MKRVLSWLLSWFQKKPVEITVLEFDNRGEDVQVTRVAVRMSPDGSNVVPNVIDPSTGKRLEFAGMEASIWQMYINPETGMANVTLGLKNVPIVEKRYEGQSSEREHRPEEV